jgi:hypothetical protein
MRLWEGIGVRFFFDETEIFALCCVLIRFYTIIYLGFSFQ